MPPIKLQIKRNKIGKSGSGEERIDQKKNIINEKILGPK